MILMMVGTTSFKFDRLVEAVDRVMVDGGYDEKLIAQVGMTKYAFKYKKVELFAEVSYGQMLKYMKTCRGIISHGGAGTILSSVLEAKKKPFIVPRSSQLGEHVDNHQLFFCEWMRDRGAIFLASQEGSLERQIDKYLKNIDHCIQPDTTTDLHQIIKKLIDYTDSIEFEK